MTTKEKNEQRQTPYLDAYSKYLKEQTTVFDVPGDSFATHFVK